MIHIDFLANKNIRKIYKWSKNNLAKIIGLGNSTNWIRLNETNKIRNIVKKVLRIIGYGWSSKKSNKSC